MVNIRLRVHRGPPFFLRANENDPTGTIVRFSFVLTSVDLLCKAVPGPAVYEFRDMFWRDTFSITLVPHARVRADALLCDRAAKGATMVDQSSGVSQQASKQDSPTQISPISQIKARIAAKPTGRDARRIERPSSARQRDTSLLHLCLDL
jgi:hypothetical protein